MSITLDINLNVHFLPDSATSSSLSLILAGVARLETKMAALDDQITALTAQVKANTDVENSALVLINGFSTQLATAVAAAAAAGATPTQLKALTDLGTAIKTGDDALAAAVAANTVAAPTP
jgi:uncharacterized small protein (DUF1192 family)